jgi:small subunit ribosomal protein S16
MLKIRLRRTGAKKQPSYRVVVAEATAPRDGTFIENLGHYNPLTTPTTFVIKEDRVREWLQRGAQPTDRVTRLLRAQGILPPAPEPVAATTTAAAPATASTTATTTAE